MNPDEDCIGCVRSSHGAHCAYKVTGRCKILPGMIKPNMYEVFNGKGKRRHKTKLFCAKLIRCIACDCGRVFITTNHDKDAIFTCPDCGFADKVSKETK
jgi:hypothetical protein